MANGRAASLEPHERLAQRTLPRHRGDRRRGGLRADPAAAPSLGRNGAGRRRRHRQRDEITFDRQARALRARAIRRFGALVLDERPAAGPGDEEAARILAAGDRARARRAAVGEALRNGASA